MAFDNRFNVVLVGLRGCGKTTLGSQLARRLALPFVDLDDELAKRAGCPVDELLSLRGEAAFRRAEREVVDWAAGLSGHVIATGGGAVLHGEPARRLADSGVVVFLDPPLPLLLERARSRPRPPLTDLSPERELARLDAERRPLYQTLSHIRVGAEGVEPILTAILRWSAAPRG